MSTPKNRPRDPDRVRHMLEAVKATGRYTTGHSVADFMANGLVQSAVEQSFKAPGEVATQLSAATQAVWPSIGWREAKDFRHLISPECFRVDYATGWHVSQPVVPARQALFTSLAQQFGPAAGV